MVFTFSNLQDYLEFRFSNALITIIAIVIVLVVWLGKAAFILIKCSLRSVRRKLLCHSVDGLLFL